MVVRVVEEEVWYWRCAVCGSVTVSRTENGRKIADHGDGYKLGMDDMAHGRGEGR